MHRILCEICSALLTGLLLLQSAHAASPDWWVSRSVLKSSAVTDDYAVLNQGQLKNLVRAAIYELHDKLPGGAGNLLSTMLGTWRTQKLNSDDYAAVTVGQLKAVVKLLYDAMRMARIPIADPWPVVTADDDDHAVVNVGQAKRAFAFVVPNLALQGWTDSDGDGFSDAIEISLATDPNLNSSKPSGRGDVPAGGDGGVDLSGASPLPTFDDPDENTPLPDFEAIRYGDKNNDGVLDDTDGDDVPDIDDGVPYDADFSSPRTGMPSFQVVELGVCNGRIIDMAENGALVWQKNAYGTGDAQIVVWTPENPEGREFTVEPDIFIPFGSSPAITGITEEGMLLGSAWRQRPYFSSNEWEVCPFTYEVETFRAEWLPSVCPVDEGDFQKSDLFGTHWGFRGPLGLYYGVASYDFGIDAGLVKRTRFFTMSVPGRNVAFGAPMTREALPALPQTDAPPGTVASLDDSVLNEQRILAGSSTGVVRVEHARIVISEAVRFDDAWWLRYAKENTLDRDRYISSSIRVAQIQDQNNFTLLTATGIHVLKTQDVLSEYTKYYHFSRVSAAPVPWVVGSIQTYDPAFTTSSSQSVLYKPVDGAYKACQLYASAEAHAAGTPVSDIILATSQGQAIVMANVDPQLNAEEYCFWADGEAVPMRHLITNYQRYTEWSYHKVSRDGMIVSLAKRGGEQRVLLLIPITAREIRPDGTLAAADGVQASLSSPVFCASVANDGTPNGRMECKLGNLRVLDDGSIIGDITVNGVIHSRACDSVNGTRGTITEAKLWVNGSDVPQAVIPLDASNKEYIAGTKVRPFPFFAAFEPNTVIADVPLSEGVNTFKFTAEDPVYHLPGYSVWSVGIVVTTPYQREDGHIAGVEDSLRKLSIQGSSATFSSAAQDEVTMSFAADDAAEISSGTMTETTPTSGVFTGTLADGSPARLTLFNTTKPAATQVDTLIATLLIGPQGAAKTYGAVVLETSSDSGRYTGGSRAAGAAGGSDGSTGGGVDGGDPTNTGGSTNPGPNPESNPPRPSSVSRSVASFNPYLELEEILRSNGGELYRYAICFGIPPALAEHFTCAFNEQTFQIMDDEDYGVVLEDPNLPNSPFGASFLPGSNEPPSESEIEHEERMQKMEDVSFGKGLISGMSYGGLDMVCGAWDSFAGAASFVSRPVAIFSAKLNGRLFSYLGNEEMAQVQNYIAFRLGEDQEQQVASAKKLAQFYLAFALDSGEITPRLIVAFATGDVGMMHTALHGSETHKQLMWYTADVLNATMDDLRTATEGQQGYMFGRILAEALSILAAEAAISKAELVARLMAWVRLGPKAVKAATRVIDSAKDVADVLDGPGGCFAAGTQVLTKTGLVNIEDLKVGAEVWSKDAETKEEAWKKVVKTYVTRPTKIFRITYEWQEPGAGGGFGKEKETLGVTGSHPFWVTSTRHPGFVSAEKLSEGDELLLSGGRRAVITSTYSEPAPSAGVSITYNFEVDDFHTYFVGRSSVWVHNACGDKFMPYVSMFERYRENFEPFEAFKRTMKKAYADKSLSSPEVVAIAEALAVRRKKLQPNSFLDGTPWRDNADVVPDPQLVEEARLFRINQGHMNPDSLFGNVAVARVKINGETEFLRFISDKKPPHLHAEEKMGDQIRILRANGDEVIVEQVFTE